MERIGTHSQTFWELEAGAAAHKVIDRPPPALLRPRGSGLRIETPVWSHSRLLYNICNLTERQRERF